MSQPFIGELRPFGFNFAPRGWQQCNGQLLGIAQNTALFSILGTTYGGNGTTNFALPDLRGRISIHAGQLAGGSDYVLGETAGSTNVTILQNNLPSHSHTFGVAPVSATVQTPAAGTPLAEGHAGGRGGGSLAFAFVSGAPTTTLRPSAVGSAGNSLPHNNIQPSVVVNWCIATVGIFPTRS